MRRRKIAFQPVILALALGAAAILQAQVAAAAEAASPVQRTLTVSGEGEAKSVPDEAHLSAGVVSEARKAADALAANTRAMNEVFATLKRFGIPDNAIQTSEFSVEPQVQPDRNGNAKPKISGYSVSNTVDVTVDLPKLGPALDALVASGANSLGSIAFDIRDPKPLLAKARAEAMKDAIARALVYAHAGGVGLGPILAVNEGGAETPRPVYAARMMAAAPAGPPPVAAGEESVTANVTVTFEIR
jgi:uncharacterized protein YggE